MFVDRIDAGLQLAEALAHYRGSDAVLLAIPRGGVPVAATAARQLGLPVDILLTKKIGHPDQPELAIGAVSLHGIQLDPRFHAPKAYIDEQVGAIRAILREREAKYRAGKASIPLKGRTAILVDDGVATGYTIRAAIELARQAGAREVVVAVPVAAWQTVRQLEGLADAVIAVEVPDDLYAIGAHYEDFRQVDDTEVVSALRSLGSKGT